MADLDADGDLDIAVGNSGSPNRLFLNGGKGQNWQSLTLSGNEELTYDIIAADLNQDDLPELIEANSDAVNRYYMNRTEH